jgi:hypothetical protein
MSTDVQPPIIERYGYTWLQHPDGPSESGAGSGGRGVVELLWV